MSEASVNSTTRLASRLFRATSTTLRQYTLEFKYYIGQSNACQLAVFLETDEEPPSFTELFSTQHGTGEDLKSVSPIWLPYVDCSHRIVFEARKVSTGHCGFTGNENYNEVEIDDIEFADNGLMTTTTPSVPPQSAATTGQTQIPPQTDEAEDHLKIGLIAGFAGAAVVVVVCIVVLVLVLRRRQVEKPRKTMDIHVADEGTFPDDVTRGHPGQQSTTTARREPIGNMAGDYQEISDVDTTTHGLISDHGHQDRRRKSHTVQYHAGLERDNLTNRSGTTRPVVTANAAPSAGDYEQFTGRAEPSHYTALDAPADEAPRGAPVPGNYEQLTTRPESSHYTALANDASQAGPSGDNYELLSARPESSHYTALASTNR
ncbi:hypothetical protein BaRGS_00035505 [Batillaria attramentaria]|uniref:CUB domain-containing protein n=1 Tax=Batillaria attramentaria TaxID=370345 RepID=A0ABD0JEL1_9CAEN